jgi:WXG100 family type VII secretion target
MTSSSFGTELATMQAAAGHVREVNSQVQTLLSNLLQRLEALYSTWKGEGATSFHTLKQRWLDDAQRLNQALMRISEAIDKNRQQYLQSEEAAKAGFGNVAGSL